MPFEFYLVPTDKGRAFPPTIIQAVQERLEQLPSYRWEDGAYLLFRTPADRDLRVPQLLASRGQNDYLDPYVYVDTQQIVLSSVVERVTDRYLYDLVIWCQQHWPCELQYGGQVVPAEDLLAEA